MYRTEKDRKHPAYAPRTTLIPKTDKESIRKNIYIPISGETINTKTP